MRILEEIETCQSQGQDRPSSQSHVERAERQSTTPSTAPTRPRARHEEILVKLPVPTVNQSASGDTGSITLTNASAYEDYEGVTYQVAKDSGAFAACTFPYSISGNGTYKFKAVSAGENEDSDVASITVSALRVDTPVITVDPE